MPVVYERKSITDLSEKRLEDIKDPERNRSVIEAIRQWIADGRPADRLPRSPAGDEIRKIRLRAKGKPAVDVRGGTADRTEMVRVDVFTKPSKKGKTEFFFVPVYPHQVMDKRKWPMPPMRAEPSGMELDGSYRFVMSLHPRSYVEVTKPNGQILHGYFKGLDISTGAINLSSDRDIRVLSDKDGNSMRSIGAKTLLTMRKYNVDRFGVRSEVKSEVRTWHGVVCTSPIPPG